MITVILLGAGAIILVGVIVLVMASGNKRSGKGTGSTPTNSAISANNTGPNGEP